MDSEISEKKIDLDTILKYELGQFGWYQLTVILLAAILCVFGAFGNGEYIFTAAKINTRCQIPGCDGENPEYRPSWISNAIPASSSEFEECKSYINVTNLTNSTASSTCPADWFDATQVVECEDYVYENTLTIAYDYNLGCDEWKRTLVGTIRMVGTFLALPITGYISDKWGRRFALTFNAFNTGWTGLVRIFSPNYGVFVFLQTFEATLGSGAFSTCYIIATELTGPKYRVMSGAAMSCFFALGQVILGMIAWGVQDWKYLTLALYTPMLLTISYYWLMPESVRWLMSKGRYHEAENILKKLAKRNGKQLSEKSLLLLRKSVEEEEEYKTKEKGLKKNEPLLIQQVFNSPVILKRCSITPIIWLTNTLIYYGISINSVSLDGNRFLNYAYVNMVEIPGYWFAILVLDRIGRKATIISGYLISGVCLIVFIFSDGGALSLAMFLIAKFAISAVMTSTYIYTSELYPTSCRHSLLGFSSMIGRVGSMLAPLTPALMVYWNGIPSTVFACFSLLSASLVLLLPETLNKKLPQNFDDAVNI